MWTVVCKGGRPPGRTSPWAGITLLELLIGISLSAVLLTSLFSLYYGAARGAAKDQNRSVANRESRLIGDRLARDFKLVGLMATQDVDGTADDVNRDVPGMSWSDSLRNDFEFANTYNVIFTGDVDDDGCTETVQYIRDDANDLIKQVYWRWSRDSVRWMGPIERSVATHADHLMFVYYDRDGNTIPNPMVYPTGGYTLTMGERARVTSVEVTLVTRSDIAESGNPQFVYTPDGNYWYDGYRRIVQRFMIRGRNLSLGA
ncbi:hypothetical protein EHM69_05555 [candidate division KSB1 bacterium]|nr:MAG: hypothetical protein EHM69_05555 [candidate division KSB1 bacterium]